MQLEIMAISFLLIVTVFQVAINLNNERRIKKLEKREVKK